MNLFNINLIVIQQLKHHIESLKLCTNYILPTFCFYTKLHF